MPLLQSSQDHLPYIDRPASPTSISSAKSLIAAALPPSPPLHPSLPTYPNSNFSPIISNTLAARHSDPTSTRLPGGLDLTRYEAPSAPPASAPASEHAAALRQAYVSAGHLSARMTNLSLLETFGRNAWLVGNGGLEDELRGLEAEVRRAKDEADAVAEERRRVQDGVLGEVRALEAGWREGVGRLLETRVAGEKVRVEVERRRREVAKGEI